MSKRSKQPRMLEMPSGKGSEEPSMVIYPVIMAVPPGTDGLRTKQKAARLSELAREALLRSAVRTGAYLGEIRCDEGGRPLPSNGWRWSISHKPGCVAAVVAGERTGIDVEEVKARRETTFRYVASDEEWALCPGRSWLNLFRYWTAKEAVLKAAGTGLAGMRACQIVAVPDESTVFVYFDQHLHEVVQLNCNGHMISVVRNDHEIRWVTPDVPAVSGEIR